MTTNRPTAVLTLAVVSLLVVAGCSAGPQNRQVTGSGTPATLSEATLGETGLSQERATNETLETQVETTLSGDVSVRAIVDVDVTTPVREYRGENGVVVGVVSTPAVQPIENSPQYRDPLAEFSVAEQVAYAQSRYDVVDLSEGEREGNVTLLESEAPLRRFEATAEGTALTVYLTRAHDGADFVTVVVVAPTGSEVDVAEVVSGVEH